MFALLQTCWDNQQIIASQAGYCGSPFQAHGGVTQGGIVSPTIFNMIVDGVVRSWLHGLSQEGNGVDTALAVNIQEQLVCFYAEDGLLPSRDPEWLQMAFDRLIPLFEEHDPS
jgi:hypothetical protein